MVDVWDTPGGRRWAAPIDAALDRGTVVIVAHPDLARPAGLVDTVRDRCARRRPVLTHLDVPAGLPEGTVGNVELVARHVAALLDLDVDAGDRFGPADVAAHEGTDGAVVHVDARACAPEVAGTWCAFAADVAAGTKDLPASDRAAVVVHVAGADVNVPDNDTNLRVLWWWGALSALDVTVLVDDAGRDPLTTATIVEVARWDVDIADVLAARWDTNPATLVDHLGDVRPGCPVDVDGPPGPVPGAVRAAWADGLVESWAGRRDGHVSVCTPTDLDRRRWHAQVRVVYPWLEELRADIAAVVAERAAGAGLDDATIDELVARDLGPLRHHACFEHHLDLPRPVRDVLDRAIVARNALAHLTPIGSSTLDGLAAAAVTARCTPGPSRT